MANELMQPPEGQRLPAKRIKIDPTHGTLIKIEKGDIFAGAGDQAVSKKQAEILCAPVDSKDVRILPDTASLYLPWSWYADRLTRCFGPMGWSLLPVTDEQNNPKPPVCKDNVMYREFILRAEGRFIASAMGECGYNPSNARMTYGDAVEGAKSNSLSRCCKVLGMAPEIYSEGWREDWIKENAVCVVVMGFKGRKEYWRRKGGLPLKDEQGHASPPCPCEKCASGAPTNARDGKPIFQRPTHKAETPTQPVLPIESPVEATTTQDADLQGIFITKDQRDHVLKVMKEFKLTQEQFAKVVENSFGSKFEGLAKLKKPQYAQLMLRFGRLREGEITLSQDLKWQEPPEVS
jgi:hypothetical protein